MSRTVFALLLILSTAVPLRADEPVVNEAIRLYADAVEKATTQLKTVRDADSAKKAAESLVGLDKQAGEWRQKYLVRSEVPGEAVVKHMESVVNELEVAWSRIVDTGNPGDILEKLPALRKTVADRAATRKPGLVANVAGTNAAKIAVARTSAIVLGTAAQRFMVKYERYPKTLGELAEPPNGTPYVDKKDRLDPWGLPFQYDPDGPKNKGLKPDVWSIGPNANDPKGRYGNWPPPRDMKKDK